MYFAQYESAIYMVALRNVEIDYSEVFFGTTEHTRIACMEIITTFYAWKVRFTVNSCDFEKL